jgi:hypothetical protein
MHAGAMHEGECSRGAGAGQAGPGGVAKRRLRADKALMEQTVPQEEAPVVLAAPGYRITAAVYGIATLLLFLAPGLMLLVATFAALMGVFMIPVVYFLRRERLTRHLTKTALRLGFLLACGILIAANFHLADARLDRVVDAVHAYRDAHGAYPRDLAALAPEHMERVPHATLWLTMNGFRWNPGKGLLTCVPVPPIGWIGYDFNTESRTALD